MHGLPLLFLFFEAVAIRPWKALKIVGKRKMRSIWQSSKQWLRELAHEKQMLTALQHS
jgi:hypothetical protein